jgi:AGZA family xanthine/uracil permease-like MFS transporter
VSSYPASTLIAFNSKRFLYCNNDPINGVLCPWLSLAGLVVTGVLTVYMIAGSLLIGIFFVTFITWMRFTDTAPKFTHIPHFHQSAGSLSFKWGASTGKLIGAFVTFLYLDFIGSCITFYSMGTMMDIIDEKTGIIPNSNKGFAADAVGTMMGGVLGSSCLTTYVESASAVKEGGRTGLTACICSILFFLMCFLSPIFAGPIPNIAEGPVLVIIGVLIFNDSVVEIEWADLTEAIPAFLCIIVQPFTNNIAYGAITGIGAYIILKAITFQLFSFQKHFPGYRVCTAWLEKQNAKSMKMVMKPKMTDEMSAEDIDAPTKKAMVDDEGAPPEGITV